jgi:hypothetical protein
LNTLRITTLAVVSSIMAPMIVAAAKVSPCSRFTWSFDRTRPNRSTPSARRLTVSRIIGGLGSWPGWRGNNWRRHFGTLEPTDIKRLRALEAENAKLKHILSERDLEIDTLKEITCRKRTTRA